MVGQVVGMGRCWRGQGRERMDFLVGKVVWEGWQVEEAGWWRGRRRGEVWTRFS